MTGRRRSPLWVLLLLVVLAVTMAGIFPFRQIIAQRRAVDVAESKLIALVDENARLEAEVEALHTEAEIERLARERFGMVRPGEIGYFVIDEGAPPVTEPPPPVDLEADRAWWDEMWDFLTGRDLDRNE